MASATSEAVRRSVSTTASATSRYKGGPAAQDVGELGERPGRRQRGAVGQPPGVGLQPGGERGEVGGQPDDEPEVAEQAPVRLAEDDAPAGRQDRAAAGPSARRARATPRSRNAGSPSSAKIARIDRPATRSNSTSASTNGRSSRCARIRPTVDLPVPRRPDQRQALRSRGDASSSAERSELALQSIAHRRRSGRPARCRA